MAKPTRRNTEQFAAAVATTRTSLVPAGTV
jgi:hypothetical protein